MKPNEHEYKVMGLAPYCKTKYSKELFIILKLFKKLVKKGLKILNLQKIIIFILKICL